MLCLLVCGYLVFRGALVLVDSLVLVVCVSLVFRGALVEILLLCFSCFPRESQQEQELVCVSLVFRGALVEILLFLSFGILFAPAKHVN